jgi:hypothetical protein
LRAIVREAVAKPADSKIAVRDEEVCASSPRIEYGLALIGPLELAVPPSTPRGIPDVWLDAEQAAARATPLWSFGRRCPRDLEPDSDAFFAHYTYALPFAKPRLVALWQRCHGLAGPRTARVCWRPSASWKRRSEAWQSTARRR